VAVDGPTKDFPFPRGKFAPCGLYMQRSDGRDRIVVQDMLYGRIWVTHLPDGSESAVFLSVNWAQGVR